MAAVGQKSQQPPGGLGRTISRPAAVNTGYTFRSTWDQNAPLGEQQLAAISALANVAAERPLPAHVQIGEDQGRSEIAAPATDASSQVLMKDLVLLNSHQFYKWHSDLERAMKSEMEGKYRHYVNTLTLHLQTCDEILLQVDSTLSLFDDLQTQHRAVATKTKTLHDACERLVQEKEKLMEFADALRSKLNYFDELEKIARQFHAPKFGVSSSHFLPLLKRLDECITYVGNNLQYNDSPTYLVKFRQLQSRAMGLIRSHALSVLRNASSLVQAAIKETGAETTPGGAVTISEAAETSLLYVRFKAAASELKSLMEEMEGRSARQEYQQLLHDCHSVYCEQRTNLVAGVVQQRIAGYAKGQNLASLTRSGCSYLMQVCQQEHQLFDHFFPASSADPSNLGPLIDPLCNMLHDTLRRRFIYENDLDLLCELVDILKAEVLEEQLRRHGEAVAGMRSTVQRTLADVQERLKGIAQIYMRDEIANFSPSVEELDYPAKLEQAAANTTEEDDGRDAYATWYPPLEKTLSCLSKLYRCIEPTIFSSLAHEAVGVCSASIMRASKLITRKATAMDGQLFLVKHLLILREQIAPFDVEFAVTYKELDFSHLLDHMRKILKGQASFLSLTSPVALSRLLPRFLENQVDAKKDLEKNLKSTCEQFIMSVTKVTVEPMLSFIAKVAAVKVALQGAGDGNQRPLREQAFATPEKVAEMVSKVDESVKNELPRVVDKMRLYLQNPSTRSILFKPIKSNILEAYNQVLSLLEADYGAEDIKSINLQRLNDLQGYLDSLC